MAKKIITGSIVAEENSKINNSSIKLNINSKSFWGGFLGGIIISIISNILTNWITNFTRFTLHLFE